MSGFGITDPTERTKPMAPQIEMPGFAPLQARKSYIRMSESGCGARNPAAGGRYLNPYQCDSTDRVIDRTKHTRESEQEYSALWWSIPEPLRVI